MANLASQDLTALSPSHDAMARESEHLLEAGSRRAPELRCSLGTTLSPTTNCGILAPIKLIIGLEEGVDELFLGLAQLAVAVILSGVAAYLAYAVLSWFSRDLDEAVRRMVRNRYGVILASATAE